MTIPAFYQSTHFSGCRGAGIDYGTALRNVTVYGGDALLKSRLLSFFTSMNFERYGTLHGEYLVTASGHVLVGRNMEMILINAAWEDRSAIEIVDSLDHPELISRLYEVVRHFDALPVAKSPQMIGHPYGNNYYHYLFDVLPQLRFASLSEESGLVVPGDLTGRLFQTDLLSRLIGNKPIITDRLAFAVHDPFLSHTHISGDPG